MIDDAVLLAWLTGRSLARGLPLPVAEHGGFRIDTRSTVEDARWVFACADRRISALARALTSSRTLLKACVGSEELTSLLPAHWRVDASHCFMRCSASPPARSLPAGYVAQVDIGERSALVRITAPDGTLAASGHCAETAHAFVYDRIETIAAHRRQGLGHVMMSTLHGLKINAATPQLLVATEAGRSLYKRLGWEALSPYATAALMPT